MDIMKRMVINSVMMMTIVGNVHDDHSTNDNVSTVIDRGGNTGDMVMNMVMMTMVILNLPSHDDDNLMNSVCN